ncbi:MAG: TRAM domain-containing protein, partial [Verrucomicrobiota bacterium]
MPVAGQRLHLEITDLAFGGEGVARVDDFVVFIPFTAPGDVVEAKLTEVKKSFGRAELVKILKPSPERVEPKCTYFGECGGCQ